MTVVQEALPSRAASGGALRFSRALFLNPPTGLYRRDDRCQCKVDDQTVRVTFPPVEIATLAAVVRRAGAEARVADFPAEGGSWDAFRDRLREFRPDFVLFNTVTATAERDLDCARAAKEILGPETLTAAKGEYMDALGLEAMRDCPELDFGFFGEAERTLEGFLKGEPLHKLDGLLYREEGSRDPGAVRRNPGHPVVESLDDLPWPARDLLDNGLYRSPETGNPLTVVHGNRGCPAACVFCPAGVMSGFKVRYRSPENILGELRECVEKHGIREFLFHGDTFTLNKTWLLKLCGLIRDSGLRIRWGCNSRVDTMDADRARAMREAGCWVVAFGLETGSQELLDKMKKGATLAQAEKAVAVCKEHGLRVHGFFVVGLPWETEETLEMTYQFARKLDPDFFDFNIAYPLPGTEYYEIALAEGLFERSPEEAGYADAAVRTRSLSSQRLTEWRRKKLLSMYLRPGYIARTLWRSGSPGVMANYVKAGARRLLQLTGSSS